MMTMFDDVYHIDFAHVYLPRMKYNYDMEMTLKRRNRAATKHILTPPVGHQHCSVGLLFRLNFSNDVLIECPPRK